MSWRGRALGAILLRRADHGVQHLRGRASEFARLIASLTAAHLRHGAVLESLRDPTHRISRMRYEAGTANLVELLESERSLAAADQALVLARLGELLNRLALYKALGGEERAAS